MSHSGLSRWSPPVRRAGHDRRKPSAPPGLLHRKLALQFLLLSGEPYALPGGEEAKALQLTLA